MQSLTGFPNSVAVGDRHAPQISFPQKFRANLLADCPIVKGSLVQVSEGIKRELGLGYMINRDLIRTEQDEIILR